MEHIYKKITLDDLRTHTMGLMPYIPYNNGAGASPVEVSSDSVSGNWGGFPVNFKLNGNVVNYATLIRKYNQLRKILSNSIKLKKISGTSFYTPRFTDTTTYDSAYTPYDINIFTINENGLYYVNDGTEVTEDNIILISDYTTFTNIGGFTTKNTAERYIGILNIPKTIKGDKVPSMLYYSQVNPWYKWLYKNKKNKDCCTYREYINRGGDEMLSYLKNNLIKPSMPSKSNWVEPTFDIQVLLSEDYKDQGVLSPFDETIEYDKSMDVDETQISGTTGLTAVSRLDSLRSRRKLFTQSGSTLPYIDGFAIPYQKDELFNSNLYKEETINKKLKKTYVADSVIDITFLKSDSEGNLVPTATSGEAEYCDIQYVMGGQYSEQEDTTGETKCTELSTDIESIVFLSPEESQNINVTVNDECEGWKINVVEVEGDYFKLFYKDNEFTGDSITGYSAVGGTEEFSIESTTQWSILTDVDWIKVNPMGGVDNGTFKLEIDKYRVDSTSKIVSTGRTGLVRIKYGENHENSKAFYINQNCGYLLCSEEQIIQQPCTGITSAFTITASSDWNIYIPTVMASWFSVTPSTGESGTTGVRFTINPNTGSTTIARNESFYIESEIDTLTIGVQQNYQEDFFEIVVGRKIGSEIDSSDITLNNTDTTSTTLNVIVYEPDGNGKMVECKGSPLNPHWVVTGYYDSEGKVISKTIYTATTSGFNCSNIVMIHNKSDVADGWLHLKIDYYLKNDSEKITISNPITGISPEIIITNDVLYAATGYTSGDERKYYKENDCNFLNKVGYLDISNRDESGKPISGETNFGIYTSVADGWSCDVVYGPYLGIEILNEEEEETTLNIENDEEVIYRSTKFDYESSFKKVYITSNVDWYTKMYYYTGWTEEGQEKETDIIKVNDYFFATSTKKEFDSAPTAKTASVYSLPTTPIEIKQSKDYVRVTGGTEYTYWKKAQYEDWCSVVPSNGNGDMETVLQVNTNKYDARYGKLVIVATGIGIDDTVETITANTYITQSGQTSTGETTGSTEAGYVSGLTALTIVQDDKIYLQDATATTMVFKPQRSYGEVAVNASGPWFISGDSYMGQWYDVYPKRGYDSDRLIVIVQDNKNNSTTQNDRFWCIPKNFTGETPHIGEMKVQQSYIEFNASGFDDGICDVNNTTFSTNKTITVKMPYYASSVMIKIESNIRWYVYETQKYTKKWFQTIINGDKSVDYTKKDEKYLTILTNDNKDTTTGRSTTLNIFALPKNDNDDPLCTIYIEQDKNGAQNPSISQPNVLFAGASMTSQKDQTLNLTFKWDYVTGASTYDLYFDKTTDVPTTKICENYTGTDYTYKLSGVTSVVSATTTSGNQSITTITATTSPLEINEVYKFGVVAKSAMGMHSGKGSLDVSDSVLQFTTYSAATQTFNVDTNIENIVWTALTAQTGVIIDPSNTITLSETSASMSYTASPINDYETIEWTANTANDYINLDGSATTCCTVTYTKYVPSDTAITLTCNTYTGSNNTKLFIESGYVGIKLKAASTEEEIDVIISTSNENLNEVTYVPYNTGYLYVWAKVSSSTDKAWFLSSGSIISGDGKTCFNNPTLVVPLDEDSSYTNGYIYSTNSPSLFKGYETQVRLVFIENNSGDKKIKNITLNPYITLSKDEEEVAIKATLNGGSSDTPTGWTAYQNGEDVTTKISNYCILDTTLIEYNTPKKVWSYDYTGEPEEKEITGNVDVTINFKNGFSDTITVDLGE